MNSDLIKFIEAIPKIELHMHIEGSLEPEMLFALAARNGVSLRYPSVEALKEAYQFRNLQEFLDLYYQGMSVLLSEQDFYDLTYAYVSRVATQNVTHTEIFFDPQGHTERGVSLDKVVGGITRALSDGQKNFGISYKLIACFLRHLSEEDAFACLIELQPYMHHIDGFGLDSSENGHPPEKFTRVFARVRELGKYCVAHAGEEGPPEYVYQALDLLHVDRIDHGNRSLENPALVKRLADEQMGLTVCPLSNLKLCGVKNLKEHPLRKMLELGLHVTVNSDDPAYFGGYMNENFLAITDALDLSREHIITLCENAIGISFLSETEKQQKMQSLHAFIASKQEK